MDGDHFADRQRDRLIEDIKGEISQLTDEELKVEIEELLIKTWHTWAAPSTKR